MQTFGETIFGGSLGKHSKSLRIDQTDTTNIFQDVIILSSQRSLQASPVSDINLIDTCCAWVSFQPFNPCLTKISKCIPCLSGLEFTGSNYSGNFPLTFVFLCVWHWRQTIVKLHWKVASVNSSKSHRFVDFLPSIRPSFLSLVVLFACGCLWMKNETTNERLTALESRINMSPVEVLVRTGCSAMENSDRTTLNPKEESAKNLLKKLKRPVDQVKLKDTSGILFWRSIGRGGVGRRRYFLA